MDKTLKIIEIRDETPDVKTFRFKLENFQFIPGQYCLASFIDNPDEKRPFTFTNAPNNEFIELTIKKMGNFTTKIHSLRIGDGLRIKGPKGEALNFDENVRKDVVFIAGGSGITPFMSALRYAIANNLQNNFILLYSNRTINDIIYRRDFDEMAKRQNIRIVHTLSNEIPPGWNGETGRINKEMIERYVKNPKEKIWYICAPPAMVKAMREILMQMDIPAENLRIEDWQIPGKHD